MVKFELFCLLLIVFISRVSCKLAEEKPPYWPLHFSVPYRCSVYYPEYHVNGSWNVMFFYDSVAGSSRFDNQEPQQDMFCLSQYNDTIDCSHIVRDGWRYLYFPSLKYCCKCCGESVGCGIIAPDWLQENSEYVGWKEVSGKKCVGWKKQGEQANYYWSYPLPTKNYGIPCELKMNATFTTQDYIYEMKNFNDSGIDPGVFGIPVECTDLCSADLCVTCRENKC